MRVARPVPLELVHNLVLIRFFSKVELLPSGCWEWLGYRDRSGYGRFWFAHSSWLAHRWIYVVVVGPVDLTLEMDHLCRHR